MSNGTLQFERTYNAPVGKVWQAITNKAQMKEWYFDVDGFKPEVGNVFTFSGGPPDGEQFLHICEILEIVPDKKLSHSWRYDGYAGNSILTWELFDEGGKTRVKLTHTGLDTFPADKPDFVINNFNEGWTHILGISLKDYLEK
jgi:uncharacterized protein YndB with AHSA1/START domain